MAIFRKGIKIGGFDVRIGLPRDRGFDPVEAQKRVNQSRSSLNRNTEVNKFRSFISEGSGLARTNRYMVTINFPNKLISQANPHIDIDREFEEYQIASDYTNSLHKSIKDRLFFFCESATLPGRTIADETKDDLYGPERKIARGVTYDDLTLTFYMGQDMAEHQLFKSWQNMAVNPYTYNANYYDEYVGSIDIFPLVTVKTNPELQPQPVNKNISSIAEKAMSVFGKRSEPTSNNQYMGPMAHATVGSSFVHVMEAFPKTIGDISMSYDAGGLVKLSVTFSYRYNLTAADLALINEGRYNVVPGKLHGNIAKIDNLDQYGKFGSLIRKLPPDIRRAGRDVVNIAKTRFPTGKIFGGRVVPPFF